MINYRYATEQDVPLILYFIRSLAEYEHMADEVVATEALLQEWIFEKRKAEVIFALEGGKETGFALFFHNFSMYFMGILLSYFKLFFCAASTSPKNKGWGRVGRLLNSG